MISRNMVVQFPQALDICNSLLATILPALPALPSHSETHPRPTMFKRRDIWDIVKENTIPGSVVKIVE